MGTIEASLCAECEPPVQTLVHSAQHSSAGVDAKDFGATLRCGGTTLLVTVELPWLSRLHVELAEMLLSKYLGSKAFHTKETKTLPCPGSGLGRWGLGKHPLRHPVV